MVGATPAAAAAIVNGCCTLMTTNPTVNKLLLWPVVCVALTDNFQSNNSKRNASDEWKK
jgi:hypothetical protein